MKYPSDVNAQVLCGNSVPTAFQRASSAEWLFAVDRGRLIGG
jgi:hypothetical protein